MKRKFSISAVVLTMLLLLTLVVSCGEAKPIPTGKLVIAVDSLAGQHLDPHEYVGGTETMFLSMIYDVPLSRNLNATLDTAWSVSESWELTDSGRGYRFHLRKGLKFQNGEDLTAEDLKFSFDRQVDPNCKGTPAAWLRPRYDKTVVEDAYTAVVYLKEANAPALDRAVAGVYIVPKDYVEQNGKEYLAKNPVGSGPFKLVKHEPDNYMEFEANPDYWRGAPYVKTITLRVVPEVTTRIAMLKTGEVDIAGGITPTLLPEIKTTPGLRVMSVNNVSKMWAWFTGASIMKDGKFVTNEASPLANKKVRQALNYAVDKESICRTLYQGEASPMVTVGDRVAFGSDLSLKAYSYDPAKAKQLLAEAGYPNGFDLTIYTSPHSAISGTIEMADILSSYFKDIGIKSTITKLDYGTLLNDTKTRKLGGVTVIATVIQYDTYTPLSLYSATGPWSMTSDTAMDALLKQVESATSRAEQERLTKQADRMAYENAHHLFLVYGNALYGVNKRVAEWPQIPSGYANRFELLKLKE